MSENTNPNLGDLVDVGPVPGVSVEEMRGAAVGLVAGGIGVGATRDEIRDVLETALGIEVPS
ncbi:hypothetical protein GCM10027059_26800 [Myceligenerans halotolerans]